MKEILIIPDIHGRGYFREALHEAVSNRVEIVCLGDYLDPYIEDGITDDEAFTLLDELVKLKKAEPHMVHLIIGNHDSGYIYGPQICVSRYDWENAKRNHEFFMRNALCFDLFYEIRLAGKRFLFSHAGITSKWLSDIGYPPDNIDEALISLKKEYLEFCLDSSKTAIWEKLAHISEERGGKHKSGSMIWADFFEHTTRLNWLNGDNMIQIIGHTRLNFHPVRVSNRLFCLDCRVPFYLDTQGVIRSWETNESVMNTDNFACLRDST